MLLGAAVALALWGRVMTLYACFAPRRAVFQEAIALPIGIGQVAHAPEASAVTE